jgi:hypothetical protein
MQTNDPFNPNLMFNQFSNMSLFSILFYFLIFFLNLAPMNAPLITVDPNTMIKQNINYNVFDYFSIFYILNRSQ